MKYLPKLASGEWIGAFGLTEPNAGTDAAGQQTMAELDGEEWVLNGSKIFITNGSYANVFIIIAMTDKSLGTKGISAFIVEKSDPGFSVGKKEKKMGIRGSATTELIFENCRIPKDRLLGQIGKGFGLAMKTLDGGRIGIAAQALGIAQGAMDGPSSIPRNANSSAAASASSRTPSSRWPTSKPRCRPHVCSCVVPIITRTTAFPIAPRPLWPSCSAPRPQWK